MKLHMQIINFVATVYRDRFNFLECCVFSCCHPAIVACFFKKEVDIGGHSVDRSTLPARALVHSLTTRAVSPALYFISCW